MISIVAHWFKHRRSTALGIISFVSSIGGTVLPVAFRNLNVAIGYAPVIICRYTVIHFNRLAKLVHRFKWSLRIIAIILMIVLGIMNLVCYTVARIR